MISFSNFGTVRGGVLNHAMWCGGWGGGGSDFVTLATWPHT